MDWCQKLGNLHSSLRMDQWIKEGHLEGEKCRYLQFEVLRRRCDCVFFLNSYKKFHIPRLQ